MPIIKDVHAKVISSMEKILPYCEPQLEVSKNSALLGEVFNLQLAFCYVGGAPILGENALQIKGELSSFAEIYVQELVPAGTCGPDTDDYYISKKDALIPDVLKPISKIGMPGFGLPIRQWRGIWISFRIPKDFKAGEYTTEFTLLNNAGQEILTLTHTLEVVGAQIYNCDLVNTNWMHYDCIEEKHGVALFSDKFYGVFESYLKWFIAAGFNTLLTPLFTPPLDTAVGCERKTAQLIGVRKQNGVYSFSFTKLKKFIRFALSKGVKNFELSHLFTQWGGKATPKIMANVEGKFQRIFGWDVPSDSPEYEKFLKAFLPKLVEFIKKEGLENNCYFHLTDEPVEAHLPTYAKCRKLVKDLIGDLPTIDAMSHVEFYNQGLVDIPVPCIDYYPDFEAKKAGPIFVYNCCAPSHGYYTNRFINMPAQRTRVLGVMMYQTDVQGYLHWGFNFYNSQFSFIPIDPYSNTDSNGAFPSGDAFIVYPFKNEAIPSVRLFTTREGFEDYCALKTLENFIGREKVCALVQEWGVENYNIYPRCAQSHLQFREKINALIKAQL